MSFSDAVESTTASCLTLEERIKHVQVHLAAVNEAIHNYLTNGAVLEYTLDTGQTKTAVKVSSIGQLRSTRRDLTAEYNELCGLINGSNIMVMRNAAVNRGMF